MCFCAGTSRHAPSFSEITSLGSHTRNLFSWALLGDPGKVYSRPFPPLFKLLTTSIGGRSIFRLRLLPKCLSAITDSSGPIRRVRHQSMRSARTHRQAMRKRDRNPVHGTAHRKSHSPPVLVWSPRLGEARSSYSRSWGYGTPATQKRLVSS